MFDGLYIVVGLAHIVYLILVRYPANRFKIYDSEMRPGGVASTFSATYLFFHVSLNTRKLDREYCLISLDQFLRYTFFIPNCKDLFDVALASTTVSALEPYHTHEENARFLFLCN